MPTIPYIIKSFRGGVSDESDKGIEGSYKHGQALNIHGRDDVLTSNQAMLTIFDNNNTTQTGLFHWLVEASDGTTYCFSNQGSIFARSSDGVWTFVYNDENGNIKGAAEFELSSGVNYLFWATNTSLARKELQGADIAPDSGAARWTDVTANWKTTLNAADYHTMRIAAGELMIANNQSLAKVDFSGNFDANALNVRPGNRIKTLEERDDYVILGSYRDDMSEEGHIWSWITTATNWVQKKRIPVKGINALISTELLLLQGGDDGELFFSDFINAVPLHAIPGGGQTAPGGVSIEDDLAVFGIYGGTYPGIWSYGRKQKNRPSALNYEYRLAKTVDGSTISTIGAVAVIDGTLFASWGTTDGSTSEYGIDSVSSSTKANFIYEGLEFDGGSPHIKKDFETVKLVMSPMLENTGVSVKFKIDKESAWRYAVLGDNTTTYSQTDAVEAEFSIGKFGQIYEVGIEGSTNSENKSPEIQSIITLIADKTGTEYG